MSGGRRLQDGPHLPLAARPQASCHSWLEWAKVALQCCCIGLHCHVNRIAPTNPKSGLPHDGPHLPLAACPQVKIVCLAGLAEVAVQC